MSINKSVHFQDVLSSIVFHILFFGIMITSYAQDKYWIMLTDKGEYQHYEPSDFLSEAALENRKRQNIPIDISDYPVSADYISQIQALDIHISQKSKWLNAVTAQLDPVQLQLLDQLDFVREVLPVSGKLIKQELAIDCDTIPHLQTHWRQLEMIGIDALHLNGYTGEGIRIAVFDNGFYTADTLIGFAHLFEEDRIIATRDFVDQDEDVYGRCSHCRHGTWVLSVMAARMPGALIGGAPDAEYILLRTENDDSETHQEEDNWIAAAEFADSLGAQIFTTSLGYSDFDPGEEDYTREDLDGETARITIAADMAAAKGIIVINSAGNEGLKGINAPADGNSVLAVGAVNECEERAGFSSHGNTADGRIKPDLMAMGQQIVALDIDGGLKLFNGTSFSCPMITGLTACLLQAHPQTNERDMYKALIQSSDRYNNPDSLYGHGIPDGRKASEILGEGVLSETENYVWPFASSDLLIYPNPSKGVIRLAVLLDPTEGPEGYRIEVFDALGKRVEIRTQQLASKATDYLINFASRPSSGLYTLRIQDITQPKVYYYKKFTVLIR